MDASQYPFLAALQPIQQPAVGQSGQSFRNIRHFFIRWRSRRRHRLPSRLLMKKMLDRAFGAQLGSVCDRNKRALGESGSFSEAFRDSLPMRASSKNNRLRMAQQYPMRSSFMSDVLSPGVSQAGTQPIRSMAQIMVRGMESFVVIRTIFSVSGKMAGITNAPVSLKTTRVFATQKIYSGTQSNIYVNEKTVFAIETGVYASSTTVSVALTKVFAALTSSYVAFTSSFVAFTSVYIALSPIYVPLSPIYVPLSLIYVTLSSIYVVFTMVKDDCQVADIAWVRAKSGFYLNLCHVELDLCSSYRDLRCSDRGLRPFDLSLCRIELDLRCIDLGLRRLELDLLPFYRDLRRFDLGVPPFDLGLCRIELDLRCFDRALRRFGRGLCDTHLYLRGRGHLSGIGHLFVPGRHQGPHLGENRRQCAGGLLVTTTNKRST